MVVTKMSPKFLSLNVLTFKNTFAYTPFHEVEFLMSEGQSYALQ